MDEDQNRQRAPSDDDDADRPRAAGLWSARRWFGAMGFPLIILAAVLAWEGYRASTGQRGPVGQGRVVAYYVGAALCFGVGLAAVRMRHRSDRV